MFWRPHEGAFSGLPRAHRFWPRPRGESNDTRLALDALGDAVSERRPPRGAMHHSDRGSPYGSNDYVANSTASAL